MRKRKLVGMYFLVFKFQDLYLNVKTNTAPIYVEKFTKELRRLHLELSENQPSHILLLKNLEVQTDFHESQKRLLVCFN